MFARNTVNPVKLNSCLFQL